VRNKFYTIPNCPTARGARTFLVGKRVDFVEFDVSTNRAALRAMLTMTARAEVPRSSPATRRCGIDPASWDALLKRSAELQTHDPYALPPSLGRDPYEGVD